MQKHELYELNYEELKTYLKLISSSDKNQILKDEKIKDKLINCQNRHEFIWLAQEDSDIIPNLLDDVGLSILRNTDDLIDKLNGILTSCQNYVSELFKSDSFCKLIQENLNELTDYFYQLDASSCNIFIKYLKKQDSDETNIFCFLSEISDESQLYVLKNNTFSYEKIQGILPFLKKNSLNYIINNTNYIDSLCGYKANELLLIFSKTTILPRLLDESSFVDKITAMYDARDFRFLMFELEKNNDKSLLETKRKKFYDYEIENFDKELKMTPTLKNIYLKLINEKKQNVFEIIKNLNINNFSLENYFYNNICKYKKNNDYEKLKEFFQKESNINLTNMIIDRHYEEVYQNFLLDLEQLVRFQTTEGKTLRDEDILLYNKLLNLDDESYEQKLKLHQELKKNNQIEKYYDDYKSARDKEAELIIDSMLDKEKLQKYKDSELSEQLGVDIYILDKDPFYAFVKCTRNKTKPLEKWDINFTVDASSYSLDSSYKLKTFYNPKENYTFLYQGINKDQIMHIYPVDSFSKFNRNFSTKATDRVNKLYTPEELVKASKDYDEIVYVQKNSRVNDELNNSLINPEIVSLYCYDQITQEDIETAKNLGIGITVVDTKKYNTYNSSKQIDLFNTILTNNDSNIKYVEDLSSDNLSRRNK